MLCQDLTQMLYLSNTESKVIDRQIYVYTIATYFRYGFEGWRLRHKVVSWTLNQREKERDLTQSYDEKPYTNTIQQTIDNTKTTQKLRLHNDCGPT